METMTRADAEAFVTQVASATTAGWLREWAPPSWAVDLICRAAIVASRYTHFDSEVWFEYDQRTHLKNRMSPQAIQHLLLTGGLALAKELNKRLRWEWTNAPGYVNPNVEPDNLDERAEHWERVHNDARVARDAAVAEAERLLSTYERDLAANDTAGKELRLRRAAAQEQKAERERAERIRSRPSPKPTPQPYGVSHAGAEHLVCDWMRHLGVLDAEVTQIVQQADGGVDVRSEEWVAQVKNYAGAVGVEPIREIFGIATAEGKSAVFFTSGRFTPDALKFAEFMSVPLLIYDAELGTISGANAPGNHFSEYGTSSGPGQVGTIS